MRRSRTSPNNRRLLKIERRLSNSGCLTIAGVDEAGRGPLAGPVVAGAVILKSLDFTCTIDDSKKLSQKKREKAYDEIFKKAFVGVGIVDEKAIDELNIYRATLRAMEIAVASLDIPPDHIIVDGKMKLAAKCPVLCVVRGDSKSMSVAAASIVAKVTRDRIMADYHKEYPQYGFARHKGYGTRLHKEALSRFGPSPIHRYSYQPVKEAANSVKKPLI